MQKFDLAIVGSGPAGLTAAVYASRYMLKTIVVGKMLGGIASEAHKICNFPTYFEISGIEFVQKMQKQVQALGIEIIAAEVTEIKKVGEGFALKTALGKELEAEKVILAIGTERRKLGLPNEGRFIGKGVSYCATCDAPLYEGRVVAVAGGRNAALTAALLLAEFAEKVFIVYRGNAFSKAEPAWAKAVAGNKKIEPIFNSNIAKLVGKGFLEKIVLDSGKELAVDGLFVEIGSEPKPEIAKQLGVQVNSEGYIEVDEWQRTNVKGLFAAGDITVKPVKQVITAAAQGAVAASVAFEEFKLE